MRVIVHIEVVSVVTAPSECCLRASMPLFGPTLALPLSHVT